MRLWQTLDEKGTVRGDEFAEELPVSNEDVGRFSRRGFLAAMGLSAAALSACSRAPDKKLIPYLDKPEEVTPGLALEYASVCGGCAASCGVVLRTRDGRPIKVEGNDRDPVSLGGTCAVGQAWVLSLYDAARAKGPFIADREVPWRELDAEVTAALARVKASSKAVRVISPSSLGPTAGAALASFLAAFPGSKRVSFDSPSEEAIAAAHALTHGAPLLPVIELDKARVIVSIGADFLGTWRSPVGLARRFIKGRDPHGPSMNRLHVIEPKLSLTGSNADHRVIALPSDTIPIVAHLARAAFPKDPKTALFAGVRAPDTDARSLDAIAADLARNMGHAVVLAGSDDARDQAAVNVLNELLQSYGSTLDLAAAPARPAAIPFEELLDEMGKGAVGAVIVWGVNPVFTHPRGGELAALFGKVDLTISLGDRRDETGSITRYLAPDHHPLEAWGDTEPVRGHVGLRQPAVTPIFETRSAVESLLRWSGARPEAAAHDEILKKRWEAEVFSKAISAPPSFQAFWDKARQDGFAQVSFEPRTAALQDLAPLAARFTERVSSAPPKGATELVLYEKVGMRDGRFANNAWLQELPDPLSKVTWTNYVCIAQKLAEGLGVREGDMVSVKGGDKAITLPALIEPGIHPRAVAIAVGYGRKGAGPIGDGKGANASPLALGKGTVTVARAPGHKELAKSQTHPSQEGRGIARETTFTEVHKAHAPSADGKRHLTMWPERPLGDHAWGLVVDLSACIGCSSCVVACQAENNIPSVGEDEVRRRREMHWMRIDRYYAGPPEAPSVTHQPMMCQHCGNAPCETVCPVVATVHSSDGLNQQVYNRCVGTRYCANNCPPKVRRFNWFDYPHDDPLARMVLNPDVAVRSRGVMEKCSLCSQRIQEGKARAKAEGRAIRDGDITPACAGACPTGAIVFGDRLDPKSRASALAREGRAYRLFDDINMEAAVGYLARVRNPITEPDHG